MIVLEWTPKYWTSNTPNIECLKIELSEHHILVQNRTLNIEQFANIKLYVPRLIWSHNNRTELRTLPNITFWQNTKLQTCQKSQKPNSSWTLNCSFQDYLKPPLTKALPGATRFWVLKKFFLANLLDHYLQNLRPLKLLL